MLECPKNIFSNYDYNKACFNILSPLRISICMSFYIMIYRLILKDYESSISINKGYCFPFCDNIQHIVHINVNINITLSF